MAMYVYKVRNRIALHEVFIKKFIRSIMVAMTFALLAVTPVYAEDTVAVVPENGDELEFVDIADVTGEDTQTVIFNGDFEDYPGMPVFIELSYGDMNILAELKAQDNFHREFELPKGKYNIASVMAKNDFADHYPLKADPREFELGEEPVTVNITYEKLNDPKIEEMDEQYIAWAKEENLPKGRLIVKCIASDLPDDTLVVPLISRNGIEYRAILRKAMAYTENLMLPVGTYSVGEITGKDGSGLANVFLAADKTVNIKSTGTAVLEISKDEDVKSGDRMTVDTEEDDTAPPEEIPEKEKNPSLTEEKPAKEKNPVLLVIISTVSAAVLFVIVFRFIRKKDL